MCLLFFLLRTMNRYASRPNFFLRSCRKKVDRLLYESIPTDKREQYDEGWEKFGRVRMYVFSYCTLEKELLNFSKSASRYTLTESWDVSLYYPSKFFSALQLYCSRFSVCLLSYDSRSTLLRRDRIKNIGRVVEAMENCSVCSNLHIFPPIECIKKYIEQLYSFCALLNPLFHSFCRNETLQSTNKRTAFNKMSNQLFSAFQSY